MLKYLPALSILLLLSGCQHVQTSHGYVMCEAWSDREILSERTGNCYGQSSYSNAVAEREVTWTDNVASYGPFAKLSHPEFAASILANGIATSTSYIIANPRTAPNMDQDGYALLSPEQEDRLVQRIVSELKK